MSDAPLSPDVQTPAVSLPDKDLQPWLFDEQDLPHRPDLVPRAKVFLHTGKIVLKDDELVQGIVDALAIEVPIAKIARGLGVSRNTVAWIRDLMVESGKLEQYKKETDRKLGRLSTALLDSLIDKAERRVLPGNIELIGLGIVTDKKGQLAAGVVPGTELREPELDPEELRAQWARIKAAKVTDVRTVESQSVALPEKPQ